VTDISPTWLPQPIERLYGMRTLKPLWASTKLADHFSGPQTQCCRSGIHTLDLHHPQDDDSLPPQPADYCTLDTSLRSFANPFGEELSACSPIWPPIWRMPDHEGEASRSHVGRLQLSRKGLRLCGLPGSGSCSLQTKKIDSGDRIEAKVNEKNHALSLMRVR